MIIMCQHCSGPILKDVEISAPGDFAFRAKTKCPHCKRPVEIELRSAVVHEIYIDKIRLEQEQPAIRQL